MARDITTRIGVDDRASPKLRKASRAVTAYGHTWRASARVTSRAMRIMDRAFLRLGRGMRTLMRRAKFMLIGLQITATIMGVTMVKSAMKYERALRNVTSLMAGAGMDNEKIERNFRRMDGFIRQLAVSLGQGPEDLARGMYNVVSATFEGESALKVLETAAQGAMAGLSDTDTVTGLLTKTLQAYRGELETNDDVAAKSMATMDLFFMSVNRGMFTFDDLAGKLGALPATASAFNVSLKDMMAFLSTATVRGVGLEEAIVGFRQALLQVGKLTPQTAKAAEDLFGKDYKDVWSAQALAANGMYGTLVKLNEVLPKIPPNIIEAAIAMEDQGGDAYAFMAERTGENVEALAALFPNIRALKAILAVSGPGMVLYAENMGFMEDATGATGRAISEMEKSADLAWQKLKSLVAVIGLDVGGMVLPFINQIGESLITWWGEMPARFAQESGKNTGYDKDTLIKMFGLEEGERRFEEKMQEIWTEATPGDRLSFILKTAWKDAIRNLTEWFDAGGEGVLAKWGETAANALTGFLDAIAGTTTGDVQDNIGYRFGRAFIDGFKKALGGWVEQGGAEDFLKSTFGRIGTTIMAGIFGGPGAAAGAWFGSDSGDIRTTVISILAGMGLWKGGKLILGNLLKGGGAAGAAGAAATGGGGAVAPVVGMSRLALAGASLPIVAIVGGAAVLVYGTIKAYNAADVNLSGFEADSAAPATQPFSQARRNAELVDTGFRAPGYGTPIRMPGAWSPSTFAALGDAMDNFEPSDGYLTAGNTINTASDKMVYSSDQMRRAAAIFASGSGWTPTVTPGRTTPPRSPSNEPRKQALGGEGTVYGPTMFMAGEAGIEDYKFTPARNRKAEAEAEGGGSNVSVGPFYITEAGDARQTAAYVVRELEKAMSNG